MGARLAALLCALTLWAPSASAEEAPVSGPAEVDSGNISYWDRGEDRWFVASKIDVGFLYGRPRFSFGYGKPHNRWIGIDLNPILKGSGLGAWAGIRAALPWIDLRVGGRYFFSFWQAYLEPRESYDSLEIEAQSGNSAQYLSWEAELTFGQRIGIGELVSESALTYVTGVDEGWNVYEGTVKVVVAPPWIWRQRLGYLFQFGPRESIKMGPVVELVGIPERDALVFRAGMVARMRLYDELSVRGTFIPALASPDALGARAGDSFQIGIRWTWATGMPSEEEAER